MSIVEYRNRTGATCQGCVQYRIQDNYVQGGEQRAKWYMRVAKVKIGGEYFHPYPTLAQVGGGFQV